MKNYTLCVKKITHSVSNYILGVKLHTVCKISHRVTLHRIFLSEVLLAFIVKKLFSVNFFTLALLLMLATNIRYALGLLGLFGLMPFVNLAVG